MYEFLAQIAQTWGLIAFVIAFILVLIYALAPSKKNEFEHARKIPLDDDDEQTGSVRNV
ncbi:MAG: cbb3-type cytochrome c oxidase subunit 3 [Marinicaulis sp.]|nr:cbb3-type cytochrome c oxidase subunit 3 [Marinicaulis sp.]